MYVNNEVISYLQANKILALKLDHVLASVRKVLSEQMEMAGEGVPHALNYMPCFSDEYQEVCQRNRGEDIRFMKGSVHLFQFGNIAHDMLKIYFTEVFKYKTYHQLERIRKMLIADNVHIIVGSLTNAGFALATASAVASGMNLNLELSALLGRSAGGLVGGGGVYSVAQKAEDDAHRLQFTNPAYYTALYEQELEMMYFLIAPLFERVEAFKAQWASDEGLADIIANMIR